MKPLTFSTRSVRPEDILLLLQPARLDLSKAVVTRERRIYLDTPDQRLRESGGWLYVGRRSKGRDQLFSGAGTDLVRGVAIDQTPEFVWEMPEAEAAALKSKIKMRRLSSCLRAELRIQVYRFQDKRQKTVTRVQLVSGRVFPAHSRKSRPLAARVIALPLKGYRKSFDQLVTGLRSAADLQESEVSIYQEGLRLLGIPEPWEPPLPAIAPGISTYRGMQNILDYLRRLILANAEGLADPVDTEFLHQFRTAIRKTRTLLSQSRAAFPTRGARRFLNFFAWLGSSTGAARDLDVYLLKTVGYDSDWPQRYGSRLDEFQGQLMSARSREQTALKRVLGSRRFRTGMEAWGAFLEASAPPRIAAAHENLEDFAARKIWKRYRKVRKAGKRLQSDGPASSLHRLRIQFKKLRYLIEFLAPLFNAEALAVILKEVKTIQDHLGDFNDCAVQAAWLDEQARSDQGQSPLSHSLAQLSEELGREALRLRGIFDEHCRSFLSPEKHQLFRTLFKEPTC